MTRPRREEFILDVRRAARMLVQPMVEADSTAVDTDPVSRLLQQAALWLTPKVVEHYDAADFGTWPQEQQDQLRLTVEEFRTLASQVPGDKPATVEQLTGGTTRLQRLIEALGGMIRAEWLDAIHQIESQAEGWANKDGWRTRRVAKKMSESLLGKYEAPQLLIYAEPNLYVLDPVARFVLGAQGSFDLAIQPSYYTTSVYRGDDGQWYTHLDAGKDVSGGQRVPWNEKAFLAGIQQLETLV